MNSHLKRYPVEGRNPKTAIGQNRQSFARCVLPRSNPLDLVGNHGDDLGFSVFEPLLAVTQPLQLFAADRSSIAVEEVEGNGVFTAVMSRRDAAPRRR